MKRLILGATALVLGASVVYADPIDDREALMKSFG